MILIRSLYLSKGYGPRKLTREFPDKGWKRRDLNSSPLIQALHSAQPVECCNSRQCVLFQSDDFQDAEPDENDFEFVSAADIDGSGDG